MIDKSPEVTHQAFLLFSEFFNRKENPSKSRTENPTTDLESPSKVVLGHAGPVQWQSLKQVFSQFF